MFNKILPMTGVEPRTSGIEIDRSTNWATTTSQQNDILFVHTRCIGVFFILHSVETKKRERDRESANTISASNCCLV